MASNASVPARGLAPKPPDKGSFPLDHFGECSTAKKAYMECLRENGMQTQMDTCRKLSAAYLQCRMDTCVSPSLRAPWRKFAHLMLIHSYLACMQGAHGKGKNTKSWVPGWLLRAAWR